MRSVHIAVVALRTALVLGFKLRNPGAVTLPFFALRVTLPVTVLIARVYLLGRFTGGSPWSLLSAPRAGLRPARPPWGSSKVAKPHLLEKRSDRGALPPT